ncbi:MAG: hypothetical protein KatS3mg111_3432 [Pirellulaceae bacterium]|nr:MAG: hypothetical protein KatS3mg111_3432 [Pirellulaceae bacterium]
MRPSRLLEAYRLYLAEGNTAAFLRQLVQWYSEATLQRLVDSGDCYSRRAAALALGLMGTDASIPILGAALSASDRKLRMVADDALRSIAARQGSAMHRQALESVVRLNECGSFRQADSLATAVIGEHGATAELFYQRSLARFNLDRLRAAQDDCLRVLARHRFHYQAMVALGHCYLQLGDLVEALFWMRRAIEVYPDLEHVRIQAKRLERTILGK